MANYLMRGCPCTKTCPDRAVGCNCQKRQEWVAEKNARKKLIQEDIAKDVLMSSYINSSRPRREKK